MERYGEVGIPDFLRLMKSFLDGEIDPDSYCDGYFDLNVQRKTIGDAEAKILGIAFHDADDYDAELRLDYTITEPELRRRVAQSVAELYALGHRL